MLDAQTRPAPRDTVWFHQARFGMFIHYGLYAMLGRGEWVQYQERIPKIRYRKLAEAFRPRRDCVDQWLDLAVEAGMKYAVLTTKHHDGFCLFDTETTAFSLPSVLGGRDLVAEFVEGCRKRGLRVGLYISNFDWNHPGYFEPARYPESRKALVDELHRQTRELLSNYGPIDLLWFDGEWIGLGQTKPEALGLASCGEFWRGRELLETIYALQPNILVNNRLGIAADLDTPEQHVTASEPGRGWESCMTIGDAEAWGWASHAANRKTTAQLLQNLVLAASGEGNFLLNIGPRPDGSVDESDARPLREIGRWLRLHGEAVYGSRRHFPDYTRHWQGAYTRKGLTVYISLFRYSTEIPVPLLRPMPVKATLMGYDGPLEIAAGSNGGFVVRGLPDKPPVPIQPVLRLEFDRAPERIDEPDRSAWITDEVAYAPG
ncbi:MAG: alpha-L-fucosidase [Planctomycetota bacterium]